MFTAQSKCCTSLETQCPCFVAS